MSIIGKELYSILKEFRRGKSHRIFYATPNATIFKAGLKVYTCRNRMKIRVDNLRSPVTSDSGLHAT